MKIQIVLLQPPLPKQLPRPGPSASINDGSKSVYALKFALALMLAGVNLTGRVIFGGVYR